MTPFYFGSSKRRLFGVYDPARPARGRQRAAVLCYPSGEEHVHAYRTMRQLATRLAQSGTHVLRFDYYGTGDSAGDTSDGDDAGWCSDILTAAAELKDMTGVPKVSLVGLRKGASLAALVAAKHPGEFEHLVLWEPTTPLLQVRTLALAAAADFTGNGSEVPAREHAASSSQDQFLALKHKLPLHTLVLLSGSDQASQAFPGLTVEQLTPASPWVEEQINTGTNHGAVLARIVAWLQ